MLLGLIYENENYSDGIKKILENLHGKYVPHALDDVDRVYGVQGSISCKILKKILTESLTMSSYNGPFNWILLFNETGGAKQDVT